MGRLTRNKYKLTIQRVRGGGFDLGAGKLGADSGRLDYLLRGKGHASRFIYILPVP